MKFLNFAFKLASQSEHPVYPMAAVIFRGGSVLSQATNGAQTGRHAEIRAIARDINFRHADLLVVRANGDNTSKPCRACFLLAKSVGIRRLFYFFENELTMSDTRYTPEDNFRDYGI